jgi:hypothetical protein
MHYDIGNMSRTQAAAFMKRRMAHANLKIIHDAMAEAGVKNARIIGRSSDGVLKIDRDCEWQYTRDPEEIGNPDVKLLDWSLGNHLYEMEPRPLRDAVRACAFDVMISLAPEWNEADEALFDLRLVGRGASLVGYIKIDGERRDVHSIFEDFDPVTALGQPVMQCDRGTWYALENEGAARGAARLGQTGVINYYNSVEKGSPVVRNPAENISWLTFVEHDGAESCATVTMAAQKGTTYEPDAWPYAGHVAGYQNVDSYHEYADEIEAISEQLGIHVEPNHMGSDIPGPREDNELEP